MGTGTTGPARTGSELALSLPTRSGSHGSDLARLARQAEEAGFDAVYIAERVADSLAICQHLLAETTTVAVGTAVANARVRQPAVTAMTAMALQEASGGRFRLGLGVANAGLNEARLGLDPVSPVAWMAEYVEVVRQTCAGGPVHVHGRYFRVDGLELDRTVPVPVPVHLAALQEGMVRLAGRVADGVILNLCPLEAVGTRLRALREAAGRRSPGLPEPAVACVVPCCVSDDAELALAAGRDVVLDYMLHPAAAALYGEVADPGLVAAVQERLAGGHREEAAGLVPDALVDAFVAHGSPSACAERVAGYRAAGVGTPIVFPRPVGRRWADAVWELAAACAADAADAEGTDPGRPGAAGGRPRRDDTDPPAAGTGPEAGRPATIDEYQPSTIGGST